MWTLEGSREEILSAISSPSNSSQREVRLKTKPSRSLLLRLLDSTSVKKIHLSPGFLSTIPSKVRNALESSGVSLVVLSSRAGRPDKYDARRKEEARKLLLDGKKAKEISKKTGLPTTAIYYYKLQMARNSDEKSAAIDST